MEHACSCSICGERSHLTRKCPELVHATPGGGGGGGHSHDDDDETVQIIGLGESPFILPPVVGSTWYVASPP